jgi:hypothetical protein
VAGGEGSARARDKAHVGSGLRTVHWYNALMDSPVTLAPDGSPDWEAVTEEFHCPLCEYNLRGLSTPRCPECGYSFAWKEIIEAKYTHHPYLFEQHPERNIRSFFGTLVRGYLPRRFWKTLLATHAVRTRRLMIYGGVFALVIGVGVFGIRFTRTAMAVQTRSVATLPWLKANWNTPVDPAVAIRLRQQYGTLNNYIDQYAPAFPSRNYWKAVLVRDDWRSVSIAMIAAGWPVLTLLTLVIFVASFHRAGIRREHLVRCAVYSADAMLLVPVALAIVWQFMPSVIWWRWDESAMDALVLLGVVPFITYRLVWAFRSYLRFRHGVATVLASQVIVVLMALCLLGGRTLFAMYGMLHSWIR